SAPAAVSVFSIYFIVGSDLNEEDLLLLSTAAIDKSKNDPQVIADATSPDASLLFSGMPSDKCYLI
ncbi:MAG: hypothetical protein ACREBU_22445, partial [Nitrososphaera sp.]